MCVLGGGANTTEEENNTVVTQCRDWDWEERDGRQGMWWDRQVADQV